MKIVFTKNPQAEHASIGKYSFHAQSGHWGYADSKAEARVRVATAVKQQQSRLAKYNKARGVKKIGDSSHPRDERGRFTEK